MEGSSSLLVYKNIKDSFAFEPYLDKIISRKLWTAFTKQRISAHSRRIKTRRFANNKIDGDQCYCQICNLNVIKDE
jgi:hypothetical protein